jgi:RNA polymerase sigma factor (sigma-70 family)
MTTRILLVDDHNMIREGLRAILAKRDDMLVVAEAENGHETLRLVQELHPDVVILDVAMPDLNGIETARRVVEDHPPSKIIALSMHSDQRFVTKMFEAGAQGYLLKDCASEELLKAIRTVMNNERYVSPRVASGIVGDYVEENKRSDLSAFAVLTAREREILQMIAEGRSTKEIADRLDVSAKTVETHRHRVMNKLNVRSVAQLTKYAVREGLTSLDP